MSKKRLTVILPGFGFGGAQHMVYEQLRHTDREKYDVRIICQSVKRNTPLEDKVEALFPIEYIGHVVRVAPLTVFRVVRAIHKTKPDIVHAHLGSVGFAAIYCMLYKKSLVITAHTIPEKAFRPKTEKQVRKALKSEKTVLVAVSEDNAQRTRKYFGLSDSQCPCINNGIDLDRFSRKEHDGFTVIHVGRQDENKNQSALLRCFARLHGRYPDTKLLLLGNGPMHEKLKELAAELNIQNAVTFTGNVANTEDYYAVSDLYVQCSHREAMPLSVLEAMAAGMPVVSTDVGGLSDVVRDNGILVPDNDENALYQAIEKIYIQTAEQYQTMCDASLRIVQGYSNKEMARAYEAIYASL